MRYSLARPSLYASIAGTSTASNRRLPGSVSSSPMGPGLGVQRDETRDTAQDSRADSRVVPPLLPLVVAGDRLDGRDHLLVGQVLGRAPEAGVAAIEQERHATIGIPTERGEELAAFSLSEGTEVHRTILLNGRDG